MGFDTAQFGFVSAITDNSGHYSIDSSKFYESSASGFGVRGVFASATGYFNHTISYPSGPLPIAPPFPFTRDLTLIRATGVVLEGRVTDRSTGAPLVGVVVQGPCASGLSDGAGAYSMTAQALCSNSTGGLTLRAAGYYGNNVSYTISSSPTVLDVTLLPGGTILQGTVTDATTHAPIAGASVGFDTAQFGFVSAITDNSGHYSIDSSKFYESSASGFGVRGVFASATGYFNHTISYPSGPLPIAPPFPFTRDLTLIRATGVVLEGRVTDRSTGAPLVGVVVQGPCASGLSDGAGAYSMTAQALCSNSTGGLTLRAAGYYGNNVSYTISSSPTVLDVTLLPGGTILQGTVTDATTHAPIAGASVGFDTAQFGFVSAITDNSGHYSIDSSKFYESSASGFGVRGVFASATGYFNHTISYPSGPLPIAPPFPFTRDLQMSSTGVTRSVTVNTSPPGLGITIDGTELVSPQRYDWTPSNPHSIGTVSPQPASDGGRYVFSSWNDGGAITHTIVAPSAETTYTASFITQYELLTTVNPVGAGTITAGGWVNAGTVSIQATPNPGYMFTGFLGDLTGTTNPQNLTMNGPKSVTANFVAVKSLQATLSVTGAPISAGFGASFTVGTSGGSGAGAVSFTAIGACANSAGDPTTTMTASSGTCIITAFKAADPQYEETTSAPVSVTATKAAQQVLTVNAPANLT